MKTAIVILNWNTKELLERFLPGVLGSAGAQDEVIVADNASTDGSVEMMKEKFPGVRLICLDKNYGFTGGYNRALEQVDGFDCFLLLNSDIEVKKGWLEPLSAFMEDNPDCGVCSPKLHALQDKERFEYAGAAGGFIDRYGFPFCRGRVLKWTEPDKGQFDNLSRDVMWTTGASLMVRCSLWRELGGLDDRFFAHMEEIDFCWRAQLAGWRVCVVPESVIWHLGGGTLPVHSPFKLKLNYRNNLLLLQNNLAKTLAADYLRSGIGLDKAAAKGCRRAARRIFTRKLLDGASGIIYLFTGRFKEFKAVLKAHSEARRLGRRPGREEVRAFLETGRARPVSGICNKCLPVQALIRGKKTFFAIFAESDKNN